MIQYIHARLNQWGRLVGRGGLVQGLGYPNASAFTRLTPSRHFDPGISDGAWEIDRCVQRLDVQQQQLCALMYVQNQSWDQIQSTLCCARMTVSNRLHAVHAAIVEMLEDEFIAADKQNYSRVVKKSA